MVPIIQGLSVCPFCKPHQFPPLSVAVSNVQIVKSIQKRKGTKIKILENLSPNIHFNRNK